MIIHSATPKKRRVRGTQERHGLSKTGEYRVWEGILTRCTNKNCKSYPDYGGRGIKVCDRWADSFLAFYSDMGPRPEPIVINGRMEKYSIDRKDNDGNYEPDNCHWVTRTYQINNRRLTKKILLDGEVFTISQLAQMSGISYDTIKCRIASGDRPEDLLRDISKPTLFEFNGRKMTLREWSNEFDVDYDRLRQRVYASKMTIDMALSQKNLREILVEHEGKCQSIRAWAREIGMSSSTLRNRIVNLKWPAALALANPNPKT